VEPLRLFTAIVLSNEIQNSLSDLLRQVKAKSLTPPASAGERPGAGNPKGPANKGPQQPIKWVEASNFHMTLRFLGDQEEKSATRIVETLRRLEHSTSPFEIELGGVGAFPNLKKPKVLFVPVIGGNDALMKLVGKMTEELKRSTIPFDANDFHAHVTLGRVKTFKASREVAKLIQNDFPVRLGKMIVTHFVLFQSRLTEKGPIYTALEKFKLSGA
jgi:RNA 2',3'-cyclic 3'-phosphodiesterase